MAERKVSITLNCGWIIWIPILTLVIWAISNFFGGLPIFACIAIAILIYIFIPSSSS